MLYYARFSARYWKRKDRALFVGSGYGNHHRDFVTPLAGSGRHRFGRGSVTRNDVPCHYASSRVQFAYGTPCPLGCELGEIPPLDTGLNAKISSTRSTAIEGVMPAGLLARQSKGGGH